eukprot:8505174-Alexandrium_andersonii.AAC.1
MPPVARPVALPNPGGSEAPRPLGSLGQRDGPPPPPCPTGRCAARRRGEGGACVGPQRASPSGR